MHMFLHVHVPLLLSHMEWSTILIDAVQSLIAILILIILYDYILISIFSFRTCNLVEHIQDVENLMKHKNSL